ncbi:type II toxin-antitoxin system VapC family toxin [Desulfonema magnum]|uniref:PIN domain-containing protein n=1 Tax=Desulfonema magnum TaxID=45655 RepID=A0A975BJA4_9BACT|nr:type II toxin-antitoxin system VapC family toxin [Desulfonema magnum]QTA86169.1 PIN domain-containing protein [Desulfonema magnum]
MKYLLDTCVISEMIRPFPKQQVTDWVEGRDERTLYLSVLTIGEIYKGISKLPESKKKNDIRLWMENDLRRRFEKRILNITEEIAGIWGEIQGKTEKEGRKMPAIDSLIAATAIFHGMTLVTRNTSDIENSGVPVLNPWESDIIL